MLDWCWASVVDAGSTPIQHWFDVLRLMRIAPAFRSLSLLINMMDHKLICHSPVSYTAFQLLYLSCLYAEDKERVTMQVYI